MKVVIIGGVAGGATAATRIRRLDEHAEITVFERSGYVSYANCGLPYYIGGVIKDAEELTLQTPQSFWSSYVKKEDGRITDWEKSAESRTQPFIISSIEFLRRPYLL